MTIEKINKNKIKIIFYIKELEENNISLHSFLSNSEEYKKMFFAILELANEEFGFNFQSNSITSDTISLNNKKFIIFVTSNTLNSKILFEFKNYNELINFAEYCSNSIKFVFSNSLYKYNNKLYLYINLKPLNSNVINTINLVLSEYKSPLNVSDIEINILKEHSTLLIKNLAIQKFI